jgi:S1-C subfamily serine protease
MSLRSVFAALLRIIVLIGGSWVVPLPAVASADDAAAQFAQARRYENAEGVPRDYGRALELYCSAASQGHADATFSIAWIYLNGRGVARNDTIGAAWLRLAAERGYQLAGRLLDRLVDVPVVKPTGCDVAAAAPPIKSAGAAPLSKKIARAAPVPIPSDKSANLDQYASMPDHLLTAGLRGTELYKLVGPIVYFIGAGNKKSDISKLGSAVAVSNTILITNCHVVKNSDYIVVKKDQQFGTARVVGGDQKTDRCFLRTTDMPLTPVQGVRPFQSIEVGEDVYALGNPRGLESTFSPPLALASYRQRGAKMA